EALGIDRAVLERPAHAGAERRGRHRQVCRDATHLPRRGTGRERQHFEMPVTVLGAALRVVDLDPAALLAVRLERPETVLVATEILGPHRAGWSGRRRTGT